MARRLRSRSVQLTAGFTTMAAGILGAGGCVADEPPQEVPTYCVRDDNTIVSNDYCDGLDNDGDTHDHDSHGAVIPYYIIYGNSYPRGLQPGTSVPPGGTKIAHTDQNGRAALGLPRAGGFGGQSAKIGGSNSGGGKSSGG